MLSLSERINWNRLHESFYRLRGGSVQTLREIEVEPETTLIQVYQKSALWDIHPELKDEKVTLGVQGRVRSESSVVTVGERIEVYRPRLLHPRNL